MGGSKLLGQCPAGSSSLNREAKRDIALVSRLHLALENLNTDCPPEAVDAAIEELTRDRSALSLGEANQEIYKLLRQGVKVDIPNSERGGQETKVVRVIDWGTPENNDFFLVSQFWISGELYTHRPDLIGFVNGLPLVLIELKKPGVNVCEGYDKNISDYKDTVPQLFHYNAFVDITDRTDPGELHEVLSARDDIIALTDEVHRSQYDTLAMNMRTALPEAKFLAFTGTPLIAGEERTREVFGDYISIYDFKQSVDDGATVQLFYENRTPELEITNLELNDEIYDVIEAVDLDPEQEEKLERVLSWRYHIITRDEGVDAVAKDIVHHFLNRGYQGKAMMVSIDKLTALKMHAKVTAEWEAETGASVMRYSAPAWPMPKGRNSTSA